MKTHQTISLMAPPSKADQSSLSASFLYFPVLSEETLHTLDSYGIIRPNEYRHYEKMAMKERVKKVHPHAISQGKGKDKRWFTHVRDPVSGKRKRMAAQAEEELFLKLYDIYFVSERKKKKLTIRKVYPEWLQYKVATSGKATTAHRQDTDFKHYYLNEPLSQKLIDTPVMDLTRADIKKWECELIRKYEMTYKMATNVFSILRQLMDYLVDCEKIPRNTAREVRIDKALYRKEVKPPAHTQVFYPDETKALMELSLKKAAETGDESFLVIPIFLKLGIRIGEVLALSFSDFDSATNKVFVHRQLCVKDELLPDGSWKKRSFEVEDSLKKGSPPREILTTDECFDLVKRVRAMLFKKGIVRERIFETATESSIQLKLYRMCDELGIPRRSPHKLRKTYISTLLNNQVDPDFVMRQAGHRQLQTTLNNYAYSTTRDEEMVKKLNVVLAQ